MINIIIKRRERKKERESNTLSGLLCWLLRLHKEQIEKIRSPAHHTHIHKGGVPPYTLYRRGKKKRVGGGYMYNIRRYIRMVKRGSSEVVIAMVIVVVVAPGHNL